MMRAEQRRCVLFTLADGAMPVYSIHLMCEGEVTVPLAALY
jgi:hypothetical protein